jgi:hypothetical protein
VLDGAFPEIGDTITLSAAPDRVHVFDVETQERLNGPVGTMRRHAGSEPVLHG